MLTRDGIAIRLCFYTKINSTCVADLRASNVLLRVSPRRRIGRRHPTLTKRGLWRAQVRLESTACRSIDAQWHMVAPMAQ